MANPIVTAITGYVDETREQLIAKTVLGAKTASMLTLQSGVKGPVDLHILNTDVVFGDGSTCSFDPEGSNEISKRTLTPKYLKVNMEFCDKNFLDTYANHMVKIAAGQKTLPYEQEFTSEIVKNVNYKLEKMIWQGDSANGNEFDGLIKILDADGAIKVNKAQGTSAYEAIKEVYANVPESEMKEDLVIFVGAGLFRAYVQEIVALNLYHYDANDKPLEAVLPGTNVKIVAVNGLNDTVGADYIVAGSLSNMFYGCDLSDDQEKWDMWYSQDNRTFRLAIEFMAGVQVAFPDMIVLGKIAK